MPSTAPLVLDLAQRITHLFDDAGLTILERVAVLKVTRALLSLSDANFDAVVRVSPSCSPTDGPPSAGP